ncbi:SAM-dependent methyltransferase [Embleya scabrispora]|uniref:SAM-dependent methyltransferase n=1 Tax=Embleya scabrispora TaxID=159449 RepID=UPI00037D6846|nr:SAM-dependent methyltransferase [Embleya scabrispora]MYS85262.1 tRNA (N6-threonylcarbamoyladenosine(37)-N6)-methyltransferase TrmO [Streptomyces sp. SID5474]
MEQPEPAAEITLRAIGRVSCPRVELVDDHWGNVPSVIHLDAERFTPDALTGLADFSHLEVVYHFHRVPNAAIETGARRPRGNPNRPEVGIFAQRAKNRPNRLAVSRCSLERVAGLNIHVRGLDAIDGTPILDLKPYLREFGPQGNLHQPTWSTELMSDYYAD